MDAEDWSRLLRSDEPLHPDLEPFLDPAGGDLRSLRHPLVYAVPYFGAGVPNAQYQAKTRAVAEAVAEQDWSSVIWLHERPYRLWAFQQFSDRFDDQTFWSLLGIIWVDSENIWQHLDDWLDLLNTDRPGREHLMDEPDRKAYRDLPDLVTVHRGCVAEVNEDGLSWTRDASRAAWFARRFSHDGATPYVYTGTVAKSDIVAAFDSRGEAEVVVRGLEVVQVRSVRTDLREVSG